MVLSPYRLKTSLCWAREPVFSGLFGFVVKVRGALCVRLRIYEIGSSGRKGWFPIATPGAQKPQSGTAMALRPLIQKGAHRWPQRLPEALGGFAPAYLVIPSRCYLYVRFCRTQISLESRMVGNPRATIAYCGKVGSLMVYSTVSERRNARRSARSCLVSL